MMMEPLFISYPMRLEPCFSVRPWGGDRLAAALGKAVGAGPGPIGESWELSDHPDGRSRVATGPLAGEFFGDLVRRFPVGMTGRPDPPERYPLLVKYIDAAEDLSIQTHPDDAMARPLGDRGKSECWYVMECRPGAEVIHGLRDDVTPEALRRAAHSGEMEALIVRRPVRRGSFVVIPPGVVHAILGGTLICEIQQASNLTYRLWDWGRLPARTLHIEESVAASRYGPDHAPAIIETVAYVQTETEGALVENEFFAVGLKVLNGGGGARRWSVFNRSGLIVNVVAGGGRCRSEQASPDLAEGTLRLGETWFLPPGLETFELEPGAEGLRLLVSRARELET